MAESRRCWCGSGELTPFGGGYLSCRECETLVVAEPPERDPARVTDDDADFYGRRYWFEHQRELGQPDLEARSVADLGERCLHWLDAVLRYKLPPGRTLELGCAHGGFVHLLAGAGFAATGLELSPWVADFARRTFDVPVLVGPLEDHQELDPGSLDVIVAMDVLEHLPDPRATMRRCVELLSDDGILVVQTPCRPAGKSFEELTASGHRFVEMLLPDEHLHLFSRRAVAELLERAAAPHVTFEPAIFAHYDMFLVAGRRPLRTHSPAQVREVLTATASGRRILALLELYRQTVRRGEAFEAADRDRRERQRQIDELHGLLDAERRDRGRAEALLREDLDGLRDAGARVRETLEAERTQFRQRIEGLETERAEAGQRIERLEAERADAEQRLDAERAEARRTIERLEYQAGEARETVSRLELKQEQSRQTIEQLQQERTETAAAIEDLEDELTRSEATIDEMRGAIEQLDDDRTRALQAVGELTRERDALGDESDRLGATVAELAAAVDRHREEIAGLRQEQQELAEIHGRAVGTIAAQDAAHAALARDAGDLRRRLEDRRRHVRELREVIEEHRTSRIYRALVRLGRWRLHDDKVLRILDAGAETPAGVGDAIVWSFAPSQPLTPVPSPTRSLPARERGATPRAAEETPAIAVDLTALLPGGENGGAKLVATALVREMSRLAKDRPFVLLTSAPCHEELAALETDNVRRLRVRPEPAALGDVLRRQPLCLLLCPMTAPPFADPRVPLISVVHDLQYQALPELFGSEERAVRDRDFRRAVETAERVVTVSEHVRGTVLESSGLDPGRVVAIHNGLAQRLPEVPPDRVDEILARHGLERRRFLLYPANFWPHKNHRMLLVAFGRLRHRRPEAGLRLVLTGAQRPDPGPIRAAARGMGLGDAVVFPGFVSEEELSALMRSCLALIFPSLYEGFGIPVVEAMACGRPVLASDAASLPEVAGDAALLFDPRKPEEITAAIERLLDDPDLAAELAGMGPARARRIADVERMARAYLEVIDDVLASPRRMRDGLFGVHGDGWTAPRFVVSHAESPSPPWPPSPTHPSLPPGRGGDVLPRVDSEGRAGAPLSREGVKRGRERGRGRGAPRALEMELISPPGAAAHPATLTARSSSGAVHSAELTGRPVLRLRCNLPAAAGWIELEVDPPFAPASRGVNADGRELGLKLGHCRLVDEGGEEVDLLS